MNFKKETGVTLIVLIVTLVILLILSGLSIKLIVGDEGLLQKAQNVDAATDREENDFVDELENMHDSMIELNR